MKIYNNSSYRYTAIINGEKYNFNKKAIVEFNCTESADIKLISQHNSTICLNWIDIILGLFSGDCLYSHNTVS